MRVCPGCRTTYNDTATTCEKDQLPLIDVSPTFGPEAASVAPSTPLALGPGTMVGAYRIEKHIATGGMGSIYAGIHPVISKRVAVKVLDRRFQGDTKTLSRFVLEARAVNQIGHHNIVDIFSIGQLDDGRPYLIMELLDGIPLHHLLRRVGRFAPGLALPVYQQLCDALRAAHSKSFVHRDLKPDNIVVLRRPPHPFIKILDFGIAKLRHAGDREQTEVGTVLGTPEYMAPEQCRGEEIDGRADIYALGVMLYEMVTGRKPFSNANPLRVLAMQLRTQPEPPSKHCELPPLLEEVILKAMAKARDKRFSSVSELLAALLQAIPAPLPWTIDLSPLDGEDAADKSGADESGADESGADKSGADKSGADKSGADKSGADKSGADKSGADKSGATKAARQMGSADTARRDPLADVPQPVADVPQPVADVPQPAEGLAPATTSKSPNDSPERDELDAWARRLPEREVDVPAPLMISSEFAFDLDELSRLAPGEEELTATAIADPEAGSRLASDQTKQPAADEAEQRDAKSAAPQGPPDPVARVSTKPLFGPLDGPEPGSAEPRVKPAALPISRPTPTPQRAVPALDPEPLADPPVSGLDSDPDIYPDDVLVGPTAVEAEPGMLIESFSSAELVIERSLHEQTEQVRSAQQAELKKNKAKKEQRRR